MEYNSKNEYWQESLRVFEKLLKCDLSSKDREIAIRKLVPLYCKMGEYEKAKALANNQTSLVICREVLLPLATVGAENARYQSERTTALLTNLQFSILGSVILRPEISSSDYGRQALLSLVNLFETVFCDGRCGAWHPNIGDLYFHLARYETDNGGSMEKALGYFDQGFDHCREYMRICHEGEYEYSAPLVSALPRINRGDLAPIGDHFWGNLLRTFPKKLVEALRQTPKYAECFE